MLLTVESGGADLENQTLFYLVAVLLDHFSPE